MARAVYRLWDEGWLPYPDRNQPLEEELITFRAALEERIDDMPPPDAQAWLEANVGEIEGLHARNRQEYDQAGLVLSGLNDRLFGLIYDLAREK